MGKVIAATPEHAAFIADNMRDDDRQEIWASNQHTPIEALEKAMIRSTKLWTATVDDVPCLMFGVAPASVLGGLGVPWLLGTEDIHKVKRQFIRECRSYVGEMLNSYPKLVNMVDVRNEVSIRWLIWLGFELSPALPLGMEGELFHPFHLEKR